MDLVLSEEQELLQQTARDFAARRSSLKRIRALRATSDEDGFSRELWREMARLGWVGIVLPYMLVFLATFQIADYVAYRDVFHADEPPAPDHSDVQAG